MAGMSKDADGAGKVGRPGAGESGHDTGAPSGTAVVRLDYRPPYRFGELLAFFRERALVGVEVAGETSYERAVRLNGPDGRVVQGWLRVQDDSALGQLVITVSDSLAPCMPQVVARVRRMFDTDCDPQAIARDLAPLQSLVPGAVREGTRLPGCFEPFETACRAVLGQQVSVVAANRFAARIVERYGTPVQTGIEGLTHVFPSPADILALDPIEDALGVLGVVGTRSRVIAQIARMVISGELDLGATAMADQQIATLLACKGIGPWTANYIAMRALSHPDAFLESDVGVAKALPGMTPKQRLQASQAWRPWRSYAVIGLWNSLGG